MIPEYNRKSLLIGIPGLLIQVGCAFVPLILGALRVDTARLSPLASFGLVLVLILGPLLGAVLLIIGLCYYAKGKGYNAALGLLGLLSCIGLLILALLPDKTKDEKHEMTRFPDFYFEGRVVGYFRGDELPQSDGSYPYEPYVGLGHDNMQKSLRTGGSPRCYYETGGLRTSFVVRSCPKFGVLELYGLASASADVA